MKTRHYHPSWEPGFRKLGFEILYRTEEYVSIEAADATALERFEEWLGPHVSPVCTPKDYFASEPYTALFRIFRDGKHRKNSKIVRALLTELHFIEEIWLSERNGRT